MISSFRSYAHSRDFLSTLIAIQHVSASFSKFQELYTYNRRFIARRSDICPLVVQWLRGNIGSKLVDCMSSKDIVRPGYPLEDSWCPCGYSYYHQKGRLDGYERISRWYYEFFQTGPGRCVVTICSSPVTYLLPDSSRNILHLYTLHI